MDSRSLSWRVGFPVLSHASLQWLFGLANIQSYIVHTAPDSTNDITRLCQGVLPLLPSMLSGLKWTRMLCLLKIFLTFPDVPVVYRMTMLLCCFCFITPICSWLCNWCCKSTQLTTVQWRFFQFKRDGFFYSKYHLLSLAWPSLMLITTKDH